MITIILLILLVFLLYLRHICEKSIKAGKEIEYELHVIFNLWLLIQINGYKIKIIVQDIDF
jgi:hypothetical protein